MDVIKKLVTMILGLVVIYGMFFTDYKVTNQTDQSFKVLWKEYSTGDTKKFEMKERLNFSDGLNNGVAIFGKILVDLPMDGLNFYNTSNDVITVLKIPFWLKIILNILLFFFCFVAAAIVMFISIPVLIYKLSFFQSEMGYYMGFCVAITGLIVISKLSDDNSNKKSKTKNNNTAA